MHPSEAESPAGEYGGWLYGGGVTSSTTRVKLLAPSSCPMAGNDCSQEAR